MTITILSYGHFMEWVGGWVGVCVIEKDPLPSHAHLHNGQAPALGPEGVIWGSW